MSNEEHLMENALTALCMKNRAEAVKNFFDADYNKRMAEDVGIKLETVLEMAKYVLYVWEEDRW